MIRWTPRQAPVDSPHTRRGAEHCVSHFKSASSKVPAATKIAHFFGGDVEETIAGG